MTKIYLSARPVKVIENWHANVLHLHQIELQPCPIWCPNPQLPYAVF